MDNKLLRQIIDKIPVLKHKYIGSFPANQLPPTLPFNSFAIVNTDVSSETGSHWILLANMDGRLFYGDSMGLPIHKYQNIKTFQGFHRLVFEQVQKTQGLCGFYCIFIACRLFMGYPLDSFLNDFYIMQFIQKFL